MQDGFLALTASQINMLERGAFIRLHSKIIRRLNYFYQSSALLDSLLVKCRMLFLEEAAHLATSNLVLSEVALR